MKTYIELWKATPAWMAMSKEERVDGKVVNLFKRPTKQDIPNFHIESSGCFILQIGFLKLHQSFTYNGMLSIS